MTTATATETTTETEPTFTIRLDDGPITPLDGRDDWRVCLVLDPEDEDVITSTSVGTVMTPMNVHHRRATTVRVPVRASGEAVRRVLLEQAALVEELFDLYEGTEWNGSNKIGQWSDDERAEELRLQLEQALEGVPTYWLAEDWLGGDLTGVRVELRKAIEAGTDLDELAEEWVATGRSDGVLLEQKNVRREIDRLVRQLREDD